MEPSLLGGGLIEDWRKIAPKLRVRKLSIGHKVLLLEPNVRAVAEVLLEELGVVRP